MSTSFNSPEITRVLLVESRNSTQTREEMSELYRSLHMKANYCGLRKGLIIDQVGRILSERSPHHTKTPANVPRQFRVHYFCTLSRTTNQTSVETMRSRVHCIDRKWRSRNVRKMNLPVHPNENPLYCSLPFSESLKVNFNLSITKMYKNNSNNTIIFIKLNIKL